MSRERKRAFTLVELLNVIAIIAILSAILWPAMKAVRGAAFRYNAGMAMKGLGSAVTLYLADHDDTFPIAMSYDADGFRAWFGKQLPDGTFDTQAGILTSYLKGKYGRDMTHIGRPYLGDGSGFGYNWGYLGSDINIALDYAGWPNCYRPARGSEVQKSTVLFATSIYYYAKWIPGGDGASYDFGFVDPPKYWWGVPNVDFRHGDPPVVDAKERKVTPKGLALIVFTSGELKSKVPSQVTDDQFAREDRPLQ